MTLNQGFHFIKDNKISDADQALIDNWRKTNKIKAYQPFLAPGAEEPRATRERVALLRKNFRENKRAAAKAQ